MAEEKKTEVEEEVKELNEEDLDQVAGGGLQGIYKSKTGDITDSMKERV